MVCDVESFDSNKCVAEEFLTTTNTSYDECAKGIAALDRIIVASPSHLTGITRMSLIPALYAYWERFFRICFSEYLRCVSLKQIPLNCINEDLAKLRVRQEVCERLMQCNHKTLLDRLDKNGILDAYEHASNLKSITSDLHLLFSVPTTFIEPANWVITDSNVRFKVIKKNCESFGVKIENLKKELNYYPLYPELEKLVDTRNDIAHGAAIEAVDCDKWERFRSFTLDLMNALQLTLFHDLENEAYRKAC